MTDTEGTPCVRSAHITVHYHYGSVSALAVVFVLTSKKTMYEMYVNEKECIEWKRHSAAVF